MSTPVPESEQIKFLLNLQRLLSEGQFTATYKYALLTALADLAVEVGDDSGAAMGITTRQIAEKFIEYYWRQAMPYMPGGHSDGVVLRQNNDRQAAVIREIAGFRERQLDGLPEAKRHRRAWRRLLGRVDQVVRIMPLWKLQVVGGAVFDFLYEQRGQGTSITLRPGVAYCLRQFHGLISELVRGAWVRQVRQYNLAALGNTADLHEFLFGTERTNLTPVRDVLRDVQRGTCLYCRRPIQGPADVDHFIPWALYPVDLGHNFVLAHQKCNAAKSDRLAAEEHLAAWAKRNRAQGAAMSTEFDRLGLPHSLPASQRIAQWAYGRVARSGGLTWLRTDRLVPLGTEWSAALETSGL